MAATDLDMQLAAIQDIAAEQERQHQSSRKLLFQSLAETYVWWKKASWDNAYLEKIYADNGIKQRGLKQNQVTKADFLRLVKLIYVKQSSIPKNIQLISNWASTIFALYHRFSNDDGWLRVAENNEKQAVAELMNYMKDSGGTTALAKKFADLGEEEGVEETPKSPSKKPSQAPSDERRSTNKRALLNLQKTHLPNVKGEQLASTISVAADADNLAVLLVKRNGDKLEIIGSSNDEAAVNSALLDVGLTYDGDVAPSLRLLCEALAVHAPPKQLKNPKGKFYPRYSAKIEGDEGELIEIKQICYPRLLIQKDGNMLISKRHQQASLTSVVIPNTPLSNGSELFLRGNDRDYLEQELINNKFLPLYTAKQNTRLVKTDDGVQAAKQITLKHLVSGSNYERNLYFYDVSILDVGGETKTTSIQPKPNLPSKHKFNYKLTADLELLKQLSQKFEEWAIAKNNVFKRRSDSCIDFEVRDTEIRIHEWWENGGYVRTHKVPFSKRSRINKGVVTTSKGGIKGTRISPLDIVQLFQILPKLQLKNNAITIEGSTELLKFSYQTELASYEVYVPSANEFGERSADGFAEYEFAKIV